MALEIDRKRHSHSFISIAPLVDIVFLLLLFFLLTSHIIKETSAIKITLPESKTSEPFPDKAVMVLSITGEGEVYIDDKKVPVQNLAGEVRSFISINRNADSVRIKADRKADVALLVRVIDEVRLAGIRNYMIITERE